MLVEGAEDGHVSTAEARQQSGAFASGQTVVRLRFVAEHHCGSGPRGDSRPAGKFSPISGVVYARDRTERPDGTTGRDAHVLASEVGLNPFVSRRARISASTVALGRP